VTGKEQPSPGWANCLRCAGDGQHGPGGNQGAKCQRDPAQANAVLDGSFGNALEEPLAHEHQPGRQHNCGERG